jgi:hypothetical protein
MLIHRELSSNEEGMIKLYETINHHEETIGKLNVELEKQLEKKHDLMDKLLSLQ